MIKYKNDTGIREALVAGRQAIADELKSGDFKLVIDRDPYSLL